MLQHRESVSVFHDIKINSILKIKYSAIIWGCVQAQEFSEEML